MIDILHERAPFIQIVPSDTRSHRWKQYRSGMVFIYLLYGGSDTSPFYVGKTTKPITRLSGHLHKAKHDLDAPISACIQAYIKVGSAIQMDVIEACASHEEANRRERFWIIEYGTAGAALANRTEGGEGVGQYTVNPEIAAAHEKEWIIIDPAGNETRIRSLSAWCREHGIRDTCMSWLLSGKIEHKHGWRVRRPEDTAIIGPLKSVKSLPRILTSPEGQTFVVWNLSAFCRERGWNRHNVEGYMNRGTVTPDGWRIRRAVWREGEWR